MSVQISRILHAGYILRCNNTQIAFDPIFENPFSRNCYAFPAVNFNYKDIQNLRLQAVFISHYHEDHCSFESLNWLHRDTPIYMFCVHSEMFDLLRQLGFTEVHRIQLQHEIKIGDFRIIGLQALDEDIDCIFHIQIGDLNILNQVDAWSGVETLRYLKKNKWDLILWPFQIMRELEVLIPSRCDMSDQKIPIELLNQLQELKPQFLIPSSCQFRFEDWSWYNQAFFALSYTSFAQQVNEVLPQTQVMKINPGQSFLLQKNSFTPETSLNWVVPQGDQNLDYEYKCDLAYPTQAQVAQQLEALAPQDLQKVFDFCNFEIVKKYTELATEEENYFFKSKIWRLKVYEKSGEARVFNYRVQAHQINLISSVDSKPDWQTEISATKLYAALYQAESLTSLYLRINDTALSEEAEIAIKDVDLFCDPLLRCLYNSEFGTYQKYQLQKILKKELETK